MSEFKRLKASFARVSFTFVSDSARKQHSTLHKVMATSSSIKMRLRRGLVGTVTTSAGVALYGRMLPLIKSNVWVPVFTMPDKVMKKLLRENQAMRVSQTFSVRMRMPVRSPDRYNAITSRPWQNSLNSESELWMAPFIFKDSHEVLNFANLCLLIWNATCADPKRRISMDCIDNRHVGNFASLPENVRRAIHHVSGLHKFDEPCLDGRMICLASHFALSTSEAPLIFLRNCKCSMVIHTNPRRDTVVYGPPRSCSEAAEDSCGSSSSSPVSHGSDDTHFTESTTTSQSFDLNSPVLESVPVCDDVKSPPSEADLLSEWMWCPRYV